MTVPPVEATFFIDVLDCGTQDDCSSQVFVYVVLLDMCDVMATYVWDKFDMTKKYWLVKTLYS